jgi:hypothetical protein
MSLQAGNLGASLRFFASGKKRGGPGYPLQFLKAASRRGL